MGEPTSNDIAEGMIPITITGLESAGKTTMIERLLTGKFREALPPTMGMNIERYELKRKSRLEFQIFDLGGHVAFREIIWANYVQLALGSIFVFDASDREPQNLREAKNWFWKVIDWTSAPVIMFVANKIDLDHMSLLEIGEGLDLMRFSHTPKVSFQVFPASIKTGENFENMFKWFFEKIERSIETIRLGNVLGLYIHKKNTVLAEFLTDVKTTEFRSVIQKLSSQAIELRSNLQLSQTSTYLAICVQSTDGKLFCTLIVDNEGSVEKIKARMICSTLLHKLENVSESEISKNTLNILSQLYSTEFEPLLKNYL
ncbi:MAG: ADP-ribosylation factor-like protein [Candidatus Hermodarchaeota archaeon]